MTIFNIISLFGGLALFLYGMRLMGDGLKRGSSDAFKSAMEKVTNNPLVGFLLGLGVTAVIQSSTATIVLTSGLVGAGIMSLHQSIGVILGANVGTTVTGQIIRLLDVNASDTSLLNFFKPSTLARSRRSSVSSSSWRSRAVSPTPSVRSPWASASSLRAFSI